MTLFRVLPAAAAALCLTLAAAPALAVEPTTAPDSPAADSQAAQPSSTYKVHVGGMT